MGVRGLTSYIAQRAEQYLQPFELHDCNLVIDGDNLACNLYKDVTGTCSAFGGDYDDFYRAVVNFFKVLKECNIQPFVLCDGGYEARKLRTVATRLRGKISVIKKINPNGSIPVFPVMLKEVFVDAVRDCGVPVMRCIFEADDELAALGRKLNCPVLSYDSDFYIHNVRYVPLVTLTVKAHTKVLKNNESTVEGKPQRRLRKNEAKHMEKRIKAHKIINKIQVDDGKTAKCSKAQKKHKSYKFLDCCVYRIEHLIARRALSKEKMPLFAALLGNDYIARSAFKNFFAVGLGKSGRSRKMKQQQKRIQVILTWLKSESVETALQKILMRLKKDQRDSLQAQVEAAISGYSNEKCVSYDFFATNYASELEKYPPPSDDEEYETEDDDYEEIESAEEALSNEDSAAEETATSDNAVDALATEKVKTSSVNETLESSTETETESDDEAEKEANDSEKENSQPEVDAADEAAAFPQWFLDKLYPAHLPRFLVDLMHLRKYINSPQIEHFPYTECNELALPILIHIFTLIHCVNGEQPEQQLAEDGTVVPIELCYLTRAVRVTNIVYKHFAIEPATLEHIFDPAAPNPLLLRQIFKHTPHVDQTKLFTQLELLPSNLRLYFLAVVYWLHKSQNYDLLHLHALLLSLVVLQTVDATIPAVRDLKGFQQRFAKIIKTERQARDKEAAQGIKRGIKPELQQLSIPERMAFVPKSDCYLVQNNLLKHFHMQEVFKKKYDQYSTIVLHGFAEFQAVVFQLYALNALLDFPYESPRMGQLFCGVFIYNLYDLLTNRPDRRYYVENFLLQDSKLMFDYYCFLHDWCQQFVPDWKCEKETSETVQAKNRKVLKKQRQAARKKAASQNAQVLFSSNADSVASKEAVEDEFFDLNNKFCSLLKVG